MVVMSANNSGVWIGWLAGRFPGSIGHLYSPGGQRGPYPFIPYALDNGAYGVHLNGGEWEPTAWEALLDWAHVQSYAPQWVLVPDVVGSRCGTLKAWVNFYPTAKRYGWPIAFAVQDGMSKSDAPKQADIIFVGGSTQWKWATLPVWCAHFPRVHVGRVNTFRRLVQCERAGAESADGTGFTRGGPERLDDLVRFMEEQNGARTRLLELADQI